MAYPTSSISTADFNTLISESIRFAPLVSGTNTNTGFMVYLTRSLPNMTVTVAGTNSIGSSSIFPVDLRLPPAVGCPIPNEGFALSRPPYITGTFMNAWVSSSEIVLPSIRDAGYRQNSIYGISGTSPYFWSQININWVQSNNTVGQLTVIDNAYTTATCIPITGTGCGRYLQFGLAKLSGNRWLRVGGLSGGSYSNYASTHSDIFDVEARTITPAGQMAQRRTFLGECRNYGMCELPDDKVIVVGGRGPGVPSGFPYPPIELSSTEIWATGTWTEVAPIPAPYSQGALVFYAGNNKVITHGVLYTGDATTHVYDIVANSWSIALQPDSSSLVPFPGYFIEPLPDGRLFVFGGRYTMIFDTSSLSWSLGPAGPGGSHYTVLSDGKIILKSNGTGRMDYIDPHGDMTWRHVQAPFYKFVGYPYSIGAGGLGMAVDPDFAFGRTTLYRGFTLDTLATPQGARIDKYRYNRGVGGSTSLILNGEHLDMISGTFWLTHSAGFEQGGWSTIVDVAGKTATINVPDVTWLVGFTGTTYYGLADWWIFCDTYTTKMSPFGYASEATGSQIPNSEYSGTAWITLSESYIDNNTSPGSYAHYSDRGICLHTSGAYKAIIRGGGSWASYWDGVHDIFWRGPIGATTGVRPDKFQDEAIPWVTAWTNDVLNVTYIKDMNTGVSGPAFVSWDNKVVSIGGGVRRNTFWSGTNAGTASWADTNAVIYNAYQLEFLHQPMMHRSGVDPAGKFYNVQILDLPLSGNLTDAGTWTNGVQLNTPRFDPTVVKLTKGTHAGKMLVIGGLGESVFGYRFNLAPNNLASSLFLGPEMAITNPRLRSVELGDPINGWTEVTAMPQTEIEYADSGRYYGWGYDCYCYYSSSILDAISGTNPPVSWSHGRWGATAIELDDGRILITGGDKKTGAVSSSQYGLRPGFSGSSLLYDVENDSWQELSHNDLAPQSFNYTFDYRPQLCQMSDGRVIIFTTSNLLDYTAHYWFFDPKRSGSQAWELQTYVGEKPNASAVLTENGQVSWVGTNEGQYSNLSSLYWDPCTAQILQFPNEGDWQIPRFNSSWVGLEASWSRGGTVFYMGSGTYVSIFGTMYSAGESNEWGPTRSDRLYLSSTITGSPDIISYPFGPTGSEPPTPFDSGTLYMGAQLIGNSRLSSTSPFPSPHHMLADPYGPGDVNSTFRSDWWKFVPASSSDYYFWIRSGSDVDFPTGTLDEGNAFGPMMWLWPWPSGTTPIFNYGASFSFLTQPDWATILKLTASYNSWCMVQGALTSGSSYYIEMSDWSITNYSRYKLGVGAVGFSGTVSGTLTHLATIPP